MAQCLSVGISAYQMRGSLSPDNFLMLYDFTLDQQHG